MVTNETAKIVTQLIRGKAEPAKYPAEITQQEIGGENAQEAKTHE